MILKLGKIVNVSTHYNMVHSGVGIQNTIFSDERTNEIKFEEIEQNGITAETIHILTTSF